MEMEKYLHVNMKKNSNILRQPWAEWDVLE